MREPRFLLCGGSGFALMLEGGQQLPGAPIPEPRGFVPTRRQDPRPVGTELRGPDIALMLEGGQQLPRAPIPEPRGFVRNSPSGSAPRRD